MAARQIYYPDAVFSRIHRVAIDLTISGSAIHWHAASHHIGIRIAADVAT
jgi:hypothetical protein